MHTTAPSAVILLAHGSKREGPCQATKRLAQRLQARLGTAVFPAFLQFAMPDPMTALHEAWQAGWRSLRILPYFLHAGSHVEKDIPDFYARAQQEYPLIRLSLLPCLQDDPGIEEVLWQRLNQT